MSVELLVQYAFAVRRNQVHIQKKLLQDIKTESACIPDNVLRRNLDDIKLLLPKWAFCRVEVLESNDVELREKEDLQPFNGME